MNGYALQNGEKAPDDAPDDYFGTAEIPDLTALNKAIVKVFVEKAKDERGRSIAGNPPSFQLPASRVPRAPEDAEIGGHHNTRHVRNAIANKLDAKAATNKQLTTKLLGYVTIALGEIADKNEAYYPTLWVLKAETLKAHKIPTGAKKDKDKGSSSNS